MKRLAVTVLVLLLGLGALSYPALGNYLAQKNGSQAIQNYDETIGDLTPQDIDALWAAAEEYNESLTGTPVHDPFLENSGMALPDDYFGVLNVRGVMAYLEIPRIGVHLPIYHGTGEEVLHKGLGHLEGSTLPVGGVPRHSVITGHTGLSQAKLFTDLRELGEGDMFYVHVLGKILAYRVDQIKVIEPQVGEDLGRFEGHDYVTLLTCTPYGVNSHRLLVRGERVELDPVLRESIVPARSSIDTLAIMAAGLTGTVMLTLIIILRVRQRPYVARRAEPEEP